MTSVYTMLLSYIIEFSLHMATCYILHEKQLSRLSEKLKCILILAGLFNYPYIIRYMINW